MQIRRVAPSLIRIALMVALGAAGTPASAQQVAFKAGVTVSRLAPAQPAALDGGTFSESFVATTFGGHYRWSLGPVALQPEVSMTARGAKSASDLEQIRLEYIEVPVMLVVPVQVGGVEVYAMGGPYAALESRCRYTQEDDGLRTSAGCEFLPTAFDRRSLDWGAAAGAGAAYRIWGGKLLLEARHAWGLRDISDDPDNSLDVRNRTFSVTIGYTLRLDDADARR